MATSTETNEAREIATTRVFDAPRDLVFRMFTEAEHVKNWWGPRGFTNTIHEMDVRPGGTWRFVMHGPDGTDYQNEIVYKEVVRPERLSYTHLSGPVFDAIVTFEELGENKTSVNMRMICESAEQRNQIVEQFGAVEGMHQTLDRLGEALASQSAFTFSREFDAPRELVFRAWTEKEHLIQWFGPKGFTMFHCTNELRPGGVMHYGLRGPDGNEVWGKWTYRDIVPPERLVIVQSFSNAEAQITRHPFAPDWPRETLSTTTFTEKEGKTTITIHWSPFNATELEQQTFDHARPSMTQGWTGTFDQLADYLEKQR
jgi:uncharacterized protein YndB with AHSA1/START domain